MQIQFPMLILRNNYKVDKDKVLIRLCKRYQKVGIIYIIRGLRGILVIRIMVCKLVIKVTSSSGFRKMKQLQLLALVHLVVE